MLSILTEFQDGFAVITVCIVGQECIILFFDQFALPSTFVLQALDLFRRQFTYLWHHFLSFAQIMEEGHILTHVTPIGK